MLLAFFAYVFTRPSRDVAGCPPSRSVRPPAPSPRNPHTHEDKGAANTGRPGAPECSSSNSDGDNGSDDSNNSSGGPNVSDTNSTKVRHHLLEGSSGIRPARALLTRASVQFTGAEEHLARKARLKHHRGAHTTARKLCVAAEAPHDGTKEVASTTDREAAEEVAPIKRDGGHPTHAAPQPVGAEQQASQTAVGATLSRSLSRTTSNRSLTRPRDASLTVFVKRSPHKRRFAHPTPGLLPGRLGEAMRGVGTGAGVAAGNRAGQPSVAALAPWSTPQPAMPRERFVRIGHHEAVAAWLADETTGAPDDVYARVAAGTSWLRRLGETHDVFGAKPLGGDNLRLRPRDLVDVVWALAARAAGDGEPFLEGAFTLHDANGSGVMGSPIEALAAALQSMTELYPRLSSHLAAFGTMQIWGLDVDAVRDGALLPGGRKHLLVQLVRDPLVGTFVFLKAERHGTKSTRDFLLHGASYVQSLLRRHGNANDAAGLRKERVPKKLIQDFARAVAGHPQAATMVADVASRGVHRALVHLEQLQHTEQKALRPPVPPVSVTGDDATATSSSSEHEVDANLPLSAKLLPAAAPNDGRPVSSTSDAPYDVQAVQDLHHLLTTRLRHPTKRVGREYVTTLPLQQAGPAGVRPRTSHSARCAQRRPGP